MSCFLSIHACKFVNNFKNNTNEIKSSNLNYSDRADACCL